MIIGLVFWNKFIFKYYIWLEIFDLRHTLNESLPDVRMLWTQPNNCQYKVWRILFIILCNLEVFIALHMYLYGISECSCINESNTLEWLIIWMKNVFNRFARELTIIGMTQVMKWFCSEREERCREQIFGSESSLDPDFELNSARTWLHGLLLSEAIKASSTLDECRTLLAEWH